MTWRAILGSAAKEKLGRVIQVFDPFAKGRGGGAGCLIRELTEGELRGPGWHVYDFQIIKVGVSPLEILARG